MFAKKQNNNLDLPVKFSVCVNEGQDKHPTMYWLPKLHKRPYKAKLIANSSSCTTTELSKLLTSCLTAIKSHVIRNFMDSLNMIIKLMLSRLLIPHLGTSMTF